MFGNGCGGDSCLWIIILIILICCCCGNDNGRNSMSCCCDYVPHIPDCSGFAEGAANALPSASAPTKRRCRYGLLW